MSLVNKTAQTVNAQVLRDETVISANTNDRVYQLLKDIIDSMVDYQQFVNGTATGTNTKVATIPGIESYSSSAIYFIRNVSANSGAATLNITGIGAKAIKKDGVGTDVGASELPADSMLILFWNSANDWFQLIGATSSVSGDSWGGLWNFASNAGAFPTASSAGKLYVAEDDHGSPGDADYVAAGTWMASKIVGADAFSEYYYK